jgi:hypothetical protein
MIAAFTVISVVGILTAVVEYYGRKADRLERDRIKQFDSNLRDRISRYVSAI